MNTIRKAKDDLHVNYVREIAPGCPRLHIVVHPDGILNAVRELNWAITHLLDIEARLRNDA
jgi:hypothetical protein